ncbi:alpha-hydroxy acid oxidase [Gynuella sunshinyii]|uniref:L-lactate dehydrogenase (FMN-dependent) and related alpha-hydroxy acid dehydrogenase n=1 Tax=Gynuella sunshinyii YC6258 TaxID=1445510 RepID=A0A0C5VBW4_9GAMM|nr:alpha-hydroxy acid oxidase [Gynuella sunshinyii]AJQ96825.1 L-lactate dehydrogenase (FMN-dependent) and related alpha-hydroxy acid dehydrogenase [Gynuella sunshinyii YC6258]
MISLNELENMALARLPKIFADYFIGGAGTETTIRENLRSFEDIRLWPRVLRGSFQDNFNTQLPGGTLEFPILAAPTAFHKLAHHDGELATARAIAQSNSLMIVSMAANTRTEDICKAAKEVNPHTPVWQQLYLQPDRQFTLHLVHQAEQAGCSGLVVTVDSPVFGIRERDLRNGFNDLPKGLGCPNMIDEHGMTREIEFNESLDWQDISWLRRQTSLPIILKGILHPKDIVLAIEHEVQAVIVSNHGGRQLDGAPATIELLPALADAAQNRIPLIVDGGIRHGTDVLKTLALGASAVAVGRPVIWGLTVNGEQGVKDVMQTLQQELLTATKLCGCRTRKDINQHLIYSNSQTKG